VFTHAAFIRAVMLGRGGVDRERLLEAFTRAGAESPRSHLSTGNVTFDAADGAIAGIVESVEAELNEMAGTPKHLFVRSADELRAIAADAPFASWPAAADAHELAVIFLRSAAALPFALPHTSERRDTTYISRRDSEIFIGTHLIGGRPSQPGAWLERRMRAPVTIRNWNTVERVLRQ